MKTMIKVRQTDWETHRVGVKDTEKLSICSPDIKQIDHLGNLWVLLLVEEKQMSLLLFVKLQSQQEMQSNFSVHTFLLYAVFIYTDVCFGSSVEVLYLY